MHPLWPTTTVVTERVSTTGIESPSSFWPGRRALAAFRGASVARERSRVWRFPKRRRRQGAGGGTTKTPIPAVLIISVTTARQSRTLGRRHDHTGFPARIGQIKKVLRFLYTVILMSTDGRNKRASSYRIPTRCRCLEVMKK